MGSSCDGVRYLKGSGTGDRCVSTACGGLKRGLSMEQPGPQSLANVGDIARNDGHTWVGTSFVPDTAEFRSNPSAPAPMHAGSSCGLLRLLGLTLANIHFGLTQRCFMRLTRLLIHPPLGEPHSSTPLPADKT